MRILSCRLVILYCNWDKRVLTYCRKEFFALSNKNKTKPNWPMLNSEVLMYSTYAKCKKQSSFKGTKKTNT